MPARTGQARCFSQALSPVARDYFAGSTQQLVLVHILLQAGERERALDRLEPLVREPYMLSPGWLRIDPTFATLEGDPRFERLLARK